VTFPTEPDLGSCNTIAIYKPYLTVSLSCQHFFFEKDTRTRRNQNKTCVARLRGGFPTGSETEPIYLNKTRASQPSHAPPARWREPDEHNSERQRAFNIEEGKQTRDELAQLSARRVAQAGSWPAMFYAERGTGARVPSLHARSSKTNGPVPACADRRADRPRCCLLEQHPNFRNTEPEGQVRF